MEINVFKDVIVPVIGGLGIFMLGLEFMANGIQALSVNRMRSWLATMAGTPIKGVIAGTIITGIIQSSTAMTVMVVGLVNAGVVALRPAISVIMGANVGTTLGNGLIALPLGTLGLFLGGAFALLYVFAKSEKIRNIALACMGFALIFYGLNLMTGGLKPLRNMPEVMSVISSLDSGTYVGLITCVFIAAAITALIHSSSATIGIVMGLGASGVLSWETAVAFSLGADLGTTVTSWMASLNLSKNAKRAAYAHISFNFIGVAVMLVLFYPALELLKYAMGYFGGDPGVVVMADGKETFPLVPVAVGLFSTAFNIFNIILLFPFVGVFERVLSKIGRTSEEDAEDFSMPRYLNKSFAGDLTRSVPAVQQEINRHLKAGALFLDTARGNKTAPSDPADHHLATDILSREIRQFSSAMFRDGLTRQQTDLVASLIEEADFSAALSESLYQIARRVKREQFSSVSTDLLSKALDTLDLGLDRILPTDGVPRPQLPAGHFKVEEMEAIRWQVLEHGDNLPAAERGSLLALLGSIERAQLLIQRIGSERASVDRSRVLQQSAEKNSRKSDGNLGGNYSPVPAE